MLEFVREGITLKEAKTRRSLLQVMKDLLRRLRGPKAPPGDPYADRFVPVRRGPKGRSGAAVAEPEDDNYLSFPPRKQ
ncbi:MAG: hypothetical protein LAO03_14720 [Acidobacteriia bacterium]|nr:hypothetical protein [Terriglobia bacterium]